MAVVLLPGAASAVHQLWPPSSSSTLRFGASLESSQSTSSSSRWNPRSGAPQIDTTRRWLIQLPCDAATRVMCSNGQGVLDGAETPKGSDEGDREAGDQVEDGNSWLDIVKQRVANEAKEEKSLNNALRRYLFVTPDGESKRSKWVDRRSALLVVQNSKDLKSALRRVGGKMEISDMNLLLRRFAHHGRWDDACELFEWMEREEKVTAATYSTYIIMLGKAGKTGKCMQVYNSLSSEHRLNPFICNSILSALVNNWRIAKAFKLFNRVKTEGFVPDAVTYSTVLSGCLKIHDGFERSQEILEEMKKKGMKPDVYAYGSLLRVYCANGREELARAVVEEMKSEGVTLTLYHYSYLLNLYAQINKPSEAEKLMTALKERGLKPNDVIYRSLMRVYCKNGCIEEAKRMFEEIQASGIPQDMVMYSAMIDAYVNAGKVYEAHELLFDMRSKGIRPGGNAYSILILGYAKLGDIDMINKLAAECRERLKGNQDVRVYNALLKAYSELKHDDGIIVILERMDKERILPGKGSFNILINHLCRRGMFGLALRTFNDMKRRKLSPNVGTYSRLISGLSKPLLSDPEQSSLSKPLPQPSDIDLLAAAYDVFKEMRASKTFCSQLAFEQFIRANAVAKNWPLSMEALACFEEARYTPDQSLLEFLLVQAAEDCHYGAMREILSEVKSRGYSLSSQSLEKAKETFSQLEHVKGVLETL